MESTEEKTRKLARALLESGRIAGLLALISEGGQVRPGFLKTLGEVNSLVLGPKFLLASLCRTLQTSDTKATLGIVARGCDERALVELAKAGQVDLDRVILIGLACDEEVIRQCGCERPYPSKIDVGEKIVGGKGNQASGEATERPGKKLDWKAELARCLKCYGCRNACPLCICPDCKLGLEMWVHTGIVPPDPLSFHLIRAFHLADKCIDCGSCQDACPAGIPLRELHRHLLKMLEKGFGYVPGLEVDRQSPLFTDFKQDSFRGSKISRWMDTLGEKEAGEVK